jgi:arylsulfatase
MIDRIWLLIPAQAYVAEMLQTLTEFPPRQEPASFNVEKLLEKLKEGAANI